MLQRCLEGIILILTVTMMLIASIEATSDSSDNNAVSDDQSSSWARLQIGSNAMASMPYGTYRINIYEHAHNNMPTFNGPKRYFYAPIVLLDHQSAYSSYNNVTKEPEMRFRVEMWNNDVEEKIAKYINLLTNDTVSISQVEIIPFDKVILSTSSSSSDYRLIKDWTPYQFHQWIWFHLSCFSMRDCDDLADDMQTTPQQFSNLKLFFSQSAQKTQRRETVIRVENIMAGEMAAKLEQRFSDKPDALLTAEDEKRLLAESSTNVLIDSFDDSDVVSPTTEAQIYNMLKDMLISSRTIIKDQSDTMWDSVFWNEDNYRPDKATRTWEEIYSKQDRETQRKMEEAFDSKKKVDVNVDGSGWGFSLKVGVKVDNELSTKNSSEYIDRLYEETKDTVEWEGEKFTPKSMSLSRINMNTLRDTQMLEDRSVRVSYSTAVLSVALNFRPYSDEPSMDQLFFLQSKIEALENQLRVVPRQFEALEDRLKVSESRIDSITPPKPVEGPMPSGCDNYKTMGHTQNGFFMVKDGTKVKTVYCDFSKTNGTSGYETIIGINGIKTSPVYFYVQRTSSLSANGVITFQQSRLNIGGAMNLATGVFTAPRRGTYFFTFTGLQNDDSKTGKVFSVYLQLNGVSIGQARNYVNSLEDIPGSLQATLQLNANDQITLYKSSGILDEAGQTTHFTGMLLDEELSL